jgi:hypothetical protein
MCEVWSVIWFLNTKMFIQLNSQADYRMYGEGTMNKGNVRKWCWLLKEGKTNVHDEE